MRVGLYARVSTQDQQTLPMQLEAMRRYVEHRGWTVVLDIEDVGSGTAERPKREMLLKAARRREVDAILVWRLDRWGRSLPDLVVTLKELAELGVGFISLTEAVDLTTSMGRAMAGLLAVFAEFERDILRARVAAGIAEARRRGGRHGRPATAAVQAEEVRRLHTGGASKSEIAKRLGIGRTSVRRIITAAGAAGGDMATTAAPQRARVLKVKLSLRVENNSKFVRGKKKALEAIERYHLAYYGARRPDPKRPEYEIAIPYESDTELDRKIDNLWREIWCEADSRNCFIEGDIVAMDGSERSW